MKKLLLLIMLFGAVFSQANAQCTTANQTITENFNAATFPACWTLTSSASHTFSRIYLNTFGSSPGRFVMPKAVNAKGILTFWAANTTNSQAGNGVVTIGALTTPGDWASFEPIDTVVIVPTISGGSIIAIQYTIDLSNYTGTNQYIGFSMPASPSRTVYFDDFNYESACIATTVSAIGQDITLQLDSTGLASITIDTIDNGSTSDCGTPTLTISASNFTCANAGTNTVILTATNNQGTIAKDTVTVTVVEAIAEETITAAQTTICTGTGTTINMASSKPGIRYYLREDATNQYVSGGNRIGTGGPLSFNTGPLTASNTYHIYAEAAPPRSYGLDFDGTNDRVTTGVTLGNTTTFTIEAYIYPRATGYKRIISSFSGSGSLLAGDLILDTYNPTDNGRGLRVAMAGPSNVSYILTTPNALTLNAWNHIAVTFNAGVVRLYVNGTQVATGTASFSTFPGGIKTFTLGEDATQTTAEFFNGRMDDVRFWSTARTQNEIETYRYGCLTSPQNGLITYYDMEEASGTTLFDFMQLYNGTMVNMDPASDWIAGGVECYVIGLPSCSRELAQTVTITVGDNAAPVANVATLPNITAQCEVTSLTAPIATDACVGTITGTRTATLPITSTTTIVWTYDDGNGNTSTQVQNVVISDNVAPVGNTPGLPQLTSACAITSLTAPTATDNCEGTITGTHGLTLPITASTTIVWTYDDGNGNIGTQTQTVTISDNIDPVPNVANLPALNGSCEVTTLTAPTATDNCAGTLTGTNTITLPITASTTIVWTYDDGNGNTVTQNQAVTIGDNVPPVPNSILAPISALCYLQSLTAPTATDNCAGPITATTTTVFPITATTTIVWTYDDGSGNIYSQNQLVEITDNVAPVANVGSLSDIIAQCEVLGLNAPTATDNCVGVVTGTHTLTLPLTASTTITWTYNDGKGNISTQTQEVIISDNDAPVADVAILTDIVSQCEVASLTAPTATDNCSGNITGTHNALLPITTNTTVTWTYVDGSGNTATQTQEVLVNDNTIPLPDVATLPALTSQCDITILTAPTATDNCAGTITGTHSATLPINSNMTITWTYDDGNGNTNSQTQAVIVNDNTAPVADVATLSPINAACEITALTAPTATDNCAGAITGSPDATLPITANTTITWTYDDGEGNTTTQTQAVVFAAIDPATSVVANIITAAQAGATYQWLDCDDTNQPIAGEDGQAFTPTANGNYAVAITVGNCSDTSACVAITGVGIQEIGGAVSMVLYPNPTSYSLTIQADGAIETITIYNVLGAIVQTEITNTFSVANLASGMYMVHLKTANGAATARFVKE